jgi:hypothetical protein
MKKRVAITVTLFYLQIFSPMVFTESVLNAIIIGK